MIYLYNTLHKQKLILIYLNDNKCISLFLYGLIFFFFFKFYLGKPFLGWGQKDLTYYFLKCSLVLLYHRISCFMVWLRELILFLSIILTNYLTTIYEILFPLHSYLKSYSVVYTYGLFLHILQWMFCLFLCHVLLINLLYNKSW